MADRLALHHFAKRVASYAHHLQHDQDEKRRRDALWLEEKKRLWRPLFLLADVIFYPLCMVMAPINAFMRFLLFLERPLHLFIVFWMFTLFFAIPIWIVRSHDISYWIHSPFPICPASIAQLGWTRHQLELFMMAQDLMTSILPIAWNGTHWNVKG